MNIVEIKNMSTERLRRLEWKLLDPNKSLPGELLINRIIDKITFGWKSKQMMQGFHGMKTASQWFRFAAHAILINKNFENAYFRRAINGTLNNSGLGAKEYNGYNESGFEITYNNMHGIIDIEILLRLNPKHSDGKLLQGILIFQELKNQETKNEQKKNVKNGLLLAKELLEHAINEGSTTSALESKGKDCINEIEELIKKVK